MHRRHHLRRKLRVQNFSALARDAKRRPEDGLRRGCAQTNKKLWPNESQFRFHPGTAGRDLARIWFLMDAPLPARFPLEMLHHIGDVNMVAIDSCFFQRAIQNFAGRSDKGLSRDIFLIPGLFAN